MATKKKLLQAAAGSAGGAGGLDITDVFSTYLYSGNSSAQTITNGIDLDGEGGLWWLKVRSQAGSNLLYDSTRATGSEHFPLFSNSTLAEYDDFDTTPTSTGFTINSTSSGTINQTGVDYASWTFRKAPKFFDVVTWTGNGVAGREISHSLNNEVGLILVKQTNTAAGWYVLHKDSGLLILNETVGQYSDAITDGFFGDGSTLIRPTSSVFTLGDNVNVNGSGNTYVAYLFAHNDGDGEFGPDSDQDVIKCGSYVGNGTGLQEIDLGFEPQWLMFKRSNSSSSWAVFDSMRGMAAGVGDPYLLADSSTAEALDANYIEPTPNGFKSAFNDSGDTWIYMAIRRGPLAPPEDATEVFKVATRTANAPAYVSDFPVDMALRVNAKQNSHSTNIGTRLTGIYYANTDSTYQFQDGGEVQWDYMNGWNSNAANDTNSISWMWKRAPGYFDVVPYTGNGVAGRTVSHNLGVAPEMMWVKARNFSSGHWLVYHKGANGGTNPEQYYALLNDSSGFFDGTTQAWNDTAPTSSVFTLGTGNSVNSGSYNYIAYLFASLAGISKVGSYTGNGSSQTINCGFSSGARFILIKRIDSAGTQPFDWYIWDTERGIVAGNDPHLSLNTSAAEVTSDDSIDPENSGFIVNQVSATNINVSSGEYIFYAIA